MLAKLIKSIKKEIRDYPPCANFLLKDYLDTLEERERRIKAEDERRKAVKKRR